MANNTYVKFLTNITETVTFKFDAPKEWDNRYKPGEKQYSYGVEWRGTDAYLTATPTLHSRLQALLPLQGKVLQILKYEDGQTKLWKIMDIHGNELAPSGVQQPAQAGYQQAQEYPYPPVNAHQAVPTQGDGYEDIPTPSSERGDGIGEILDTIDKMRAWAKKANAEIASMADKIVALETLVTDNARRMVEVEDDMAGLKGVVLNDDTMCAFQFHKDVTRGMTKTWEQYHMEWSVKDALGKVKDDSVVVEPDN